ncbi:MAG: PAS domain S-box protein [Limisphaerales bacterium]
MSADTQHTAGVVSGSARSDEALRETNALERAILECADYSIISTTPEGVIRTFNRAAERMLGYAASEVVGHVTPELIHDREEVALRAAELTTELERAVAPGFEAFVARARLGLADEQEWTYVRKDGSRFPVQLSVTAMRDAAGVITGFLGIAHDISRRREAQARVGQLTADLGRRVRERTADLEASQKRYEILATVAPVGIYHTTGDGHCVYVNERWCELAGRTAAEALGEGWVKALHPADRAAVFDEWNRAVLERRLFKMEYRYQHPDGLVTWVLGHAVAERDSAGSIVGYVGTVTDITESKRAEQVTATFAELGRALSAADSRRAAAGTIMVAADKLLRFDAALLHLMSKDRKRVFRVLTVDTVNGWRSEQPVEYEAIEPSLMFRRVLKQGAQLVLREGSAEAAIHFEPFGDPRRKSASLMFVPLRAGENTLGILSLQSYAPRAYTQADLDLLQSLADHAAGAFERLETEDTLAESEQRFRGTFEQAAVGVAHIGLDGRWLRVNNWVCDIVGYSREELMTRTFQDITHPDDLAPDLEFVRRMLTGEIPNYGMDKRYFHKDGSIVWIRLTVSLVRAPGGAPKYFISIIQDIRARKAAEEALLHARNELEQRVQERTAELARANMLLHTEVEERKSIEAALRDSQARQRTIIDSTPDWIFIKDREFRYQMANVGYAKAFHIRPEDFIGKTDLELGLPAELVLGDPARGIRGFRTDDREVMESGQMMLIPEEPGMAAGQPVVLNTVKVPLRDATGKVTGVLGYVRDITEHKAMENELHHREEQLRDLFENASDLIQSVASDGRILFVNRAWLNTLGYRMGDLAALTVFDIIHPDCLAECREQFTRVLQGEALENLQAVFRARDGRAVHVEGNASCRFEDGRPVSTRAIFRDITKRKLVEAERERLIAELQAALAEVHTLSGLLPICGWCKKIRDDSGYWNSVEGYLKKSSGVDITHGICPDCSAKMMVDLDKVAGPAPGTPPAP